MYTDFILSENIYLICFGFLCGIVARFKNNELLDSNNLVWNLVRWKGHLDKLLPSPSKVAKVKHFTALPYKEIPQFMQQLRIQPGIGAAALQFSILTAARSGEVRGALWSEINMAERLWLIPGDRMKAGREHRIPLSDAAMAVLERMKAIHVSDYLFPGVKQDKPLSDMSLTATLKRMGRSDLTAHDFRSTFRDWASETTAYPQEVCEMALIKKNDESFKPALVLYKYAVRFPQHPEAYYREQAESFLVELDARL